MKTIEGEIYEAFGKAGVILKANAGDPSKVMIPVGDVNVRVVFNGQRGQIKAFMQLGT